MRVVLAAALCLALFACDAAPSAPRVTVEEAWVQPPVVAGRPGAAYFTLRTNTDPTRLVGVGSPQARRIELHESVMEGGISRMKPATDLTFGDGLEFKPGGKHAMLFDLNPAVKPGGTMTLTFTFQSAPSVTVQAEVRGGGGHGKH